MKKNAKNAFVILWDHFTSQVEKNNSNIRIIYTFPNPYFQPKILTLIFIGYICQLPKYQVSCEHTVRANLRANTDMVLLYCCCDVYANSVTNAEAC